MKQRMILFSIGCSRDHFGQMEEGQVTGFAWLFSEVCAEARRYVKQLKNVLLPKNLDPGLRFTLINIMSTGASFWNVSDDVKKQISELQAKSQLFRRGARVVRGQNRRSTKAAIQPSNSSGQHQRRTKRVRRGAKRPAPTNDSKASSSKAPKRPRKDQ